MSLASKIYSGFVVHKRSIPVVHIFQYSDTMVLLDLAELESANSPELKICKKRFKRSDHFGDQGQPLSTCVKTLVESEFLKRPSGRIEILTHIRQLGYVMNPVSFIYCWSAVDDRVEFVVAEVHNTPWGETHCYVFECVEGEKNLFRFPKAFHVSPFMGMNQEYEWTFPEPCENLLVGMTTFEDGIERFGAGLMLSEQPMTVSTLRKLIWLRPFTTVAVTTRIYWQALKLWLKKCPYYPHPRKLNGDPRKT